MDVLEQYARNLLDKLQPNSNIFWMIADARKYRAATGENIPDAGPGRWYDTGIQKTCIMLEKLGYEIVDPDVGTILRDPIIHFRKKG
jgi:hypothetical protein